MVASPVVEHSLSSAPASAGAASVLQSTGSVLVVHALSYSAACGILLIRSRTRVSLFGRWILYH